MKTIVMSDEEESRLLTEFYNPPPAGNEIEDAKFQSDIKRLYQRLVKILSRFGEEGDNYGISDFAVRPDLRERRTFFPPPAPPTREFCITVITEKFYRSNYLKPLCEFLQNEAKGYRVQIAQDFDPNWLLTLFLTADLAQICSDSAGEIQNLETILVGL